MYYNHRYHKEIKHYVSTFNSVQPLWLMVENQIPNAWLDFNEHQTNESFRNSLSISLSKNLIYSTVTRMDMVRCMESDQ